jgi:hypothetical protein
MMEGSMETVSWRLESDGEVVWSDILLLLLTLLLQLYPWACAPMIPS